MLTILAAAVPYCGTPPTAATLMARWNLDPWLWLGLCGGAAAYFISRSQDRGRASDEAKRRLASFATGWFLTALVLVSPLCALSVSLFSARVGQHMILTLVAAPLVAVGLPMRRAGLAHQEVFAATLFAAMLWIWHSPIAYAATFSNDVAYWAMHLTTYGAAVGFWWTLACVRSTRLAASIAATVATGLQMALLGALITWAPRPLYARHLTTTQSWGLTPLQDQELGGAIMWVPAGLIFMTAIVVPLALAMRPRRSALAGLSAS